MATNKIESEKTLAYAVAFIFCTSGKITFKMDNKMYQHVKTACDAREDGRGNNTLELVYNYKAMKYEVFVVSDEKIGTKEIEIL